MDAAINLNLTSAPNVVRAFGEELHFYLTGEETDGRFTQWLEITPPGVGPPLHYHTNEEEWFYVQMGTVSFYREGKWTEVGAGSRVYIPRGVVHAFKNTGDEPLHMLITTAPSGFENFMGRCAVEFAAPSGPDMGRIIEIAGEHGIHFVQD
ncbi:cupin domain-containing protein [Phragmitibacter flavus]|uniref:Cupin domain-containing protein n=1 Tax=Phragmitibacter flavus TaxID=2576071 RepID=A0A5R8KBW2_9BACT|nr:cupin domain-containing protein [Phragmitibacter flavus]TLD69794.1 cupin domain-containing protein [Phragmitibacter flavus]